VLLQEGYRRGDLSLVYPTARATGPLLSASFAVIVLHERISVQTALGGLVIVAGVLCLAGGVRRGGPRAPVSLAFGLAVGVLIGIYTVWDAHAVKVLAVPPLILDYCGNIGRAVFLSPIGYARRDIVARCWREHWKGLLVVGLLTPLSYILVLYALTFTSVVYVAPAREVSVLIAILMGSVLLKEGDLRRRLFWGAVILVGMVLLATG
jgi:drug/metabolite transporter (DMT)-like permease